MYTYRASSIYDCKRKLSALRLGIEPAPAPDWLETAAKEGKRHEEWIKEDLRAEGYEIKSEATCPICYQEAGIIRDGIHVELKDSSLPFVIVGHMDGETKKPLDNERILEIKSRSDHEYYRWNREQWAGFPTAANQFTVYWAATGATHGLYIVKNRSSGFVEKNFLEVPPRDITEVLSHIHEVEDWCTSHNYPMVSTYDENSIECKRCRWVNILGCVLKPSFEPQDFEDLEDAEWHYLQGKELEKWGKALVSASKGCFEEHSIAQGLKGQTWTFGKLRIKHQHVERKGYEVQPSEHDETRITVIKERE